MDTIKLKKLKEQKESISRHVIQFKKLVEEELDEIKLEDIKPYQLISVMLTILKKLEMEQLGEKDKKLLYILDIDEKFELNQLVMEFAVVIKQCSSKDFFKDFERMLYSYVIV